MNTRITSIHDMKNSLLLLLSLFLVSNLHLVAQNDEPPPPPQAADQPYDSIVTNPINDSIIVVQEDRIMDSIRMHNLNQQLLRNHQEQSSGGRMIFLFVKLGFGVIALVALIIRLANRKK